MPRLPWMEIGYVARAQGIRGELRVRLHNEGSSVLEAVSDVQLEGPGALPRRPARLRSARSAGAQAVIALDGVTDRTAAEGLVGARVYVDRARLPALEADEYYHSDLIGLKVVDEAGQPLGTLDEIFSTPANDIYVVRGGAIGELMVPAVAPYIGVIDLEAGTIVLHQLADLLED